MPVVGAANLGHTASMSDHEVMPPLECLDEDDWCRARDELIEWIAGRPGWVRARGALEYLPSKPPCLVPMARPMKNPCSPTSIDDSELVVYPPTLTYSLDGTEDMEDYSSAGWRHAVVPSAAEITGLDDAAVARGEVLSLRIGEDHPEQIRREIQRIESWRWPDNLPNQDDTWVEHWQPGLPADVDGLATALQERGWIKTETLTEGDLLARPRPEWFYPKSGDRTVTVIVPSRNGDGYLVLVPRARAPRLLCADAAQVIVHLERIETWTAKHLPRWVTQDRCRVEASCPRCDCLAGQPCTNGPGDGWEIVTHVERLSAEAMDVGAGRALGPKPGQRPVIHKRRRR